MYFLWIYPLYINIIFGHCSDLLVVRYFKLNMSGYRSNDAEWERMKEKLVRTLFPKIISILFPDENESGDTNNVPTQEVLASTPSSYSPLPPLIIEIVPYVDRHDESKEYYDRMFKNIKRLYIKLFIENRNLSSIDSNSDNDDSDKNTDVSVESVNVGFLERDSSDNGNFDSFIEGGEATQNSVSTKSDLESKKSATNKDDTKISEEESGSETIDGDENSRPSRNKECSRERIDDSELSGGEDSHHSIIDDHEMTESEESNDPEDEEQPSNVTKSQQVSYENGLKSKEFKNTATEDGNKLLKKSNLEPIEEDVETTSNSSEGPHFRQITTVATVHCDGSQHGDDELMEVYVILEENADPKTVPSFDIDTPEPDAKLEEIIKTKTPQADTTEENAEATTTPRLDDPGENEEISISQPESVEEDVEGNGSLAPIEEMRSPRPHLSHETIPITHRSHSESTSEHTAFPQELTALTSSTQDGAGNNMSEIQTLDDMNEISTFNESRKKDVTPDHGRKRKLEDKSVQTGTPITRKKIKLVHDAVQTVQTGVTMTWDDIRSKLFILSLGLPVPKVFRLCACTDDDINCH